MSIQTKLQAGTATHAENNAGLHDTIAKLQERVKVLEGVDSYEDAHGQWGVIGIATAAELHLEYTDGDIAELWPVHHLPHVFACKVDGSWKSFATKEEAREALAEGEG